MWRALVLAAGLSMCLLGSEFMVVDRIVLADTAEARQATDYLDRSYGDSAYTTSTPLYDGALTTPRRRVFVPPEWAPWGLLSAGVLVVLYGTAIPKG